jgi:hypothetical protein
MDDLDAFFDEVDEVEEEVKKDLKSNTVKKEFRIYEKDRPIGRIKEIPPAKRARTDDVPHQNTVTTTPGNITQNRGTIVVSKTAVVASAAPQLSNLKQEPIIHHIILPKVIESFAQPHLPPQPPLPNASILIESKNKSVKREAAGVSWTDTTLTDFPENDFRLFVGNLAKEISDAKLAEAFSSKYPSFAMAKVIYDKKTQESKGFGFVSLMDPRDCARAMREMDQSWLGSRPIKVKRSEWKDRDAKEVQKGKRRKNRRGAY